jgi:hypothetical protein
MVGMSFMHQRVPGASAVCQTRESHFETPLRPRSILTHQLTSP